VHRKSAKECISNYSQPCKQIGELIFLLRFFLAPLYAKRSARQSARPVPPFSAQRENVAELEANRKLVEANRELIVQLEAKTKANLVEVWREETTNVG